MKPDANSVRNTHRKVIGGVEVFSDNSTKFTLMQRVEELQSLALLDVLTKIGNRRYAAITLHARFDEMQRYGWTFGILFIDIDHFKRINDIYGHEAGDKVLRAVSRTMQNSIRSFDALCRWGGEEFVAVISLTDEDRLYGMAERLRRLVEQSSIPTEEGAVSATVSVGATLAHANDTSQTALKRADSLMYESKTKGCNTVSLG